MPIRGISLWEPWATAIAVGLKRIETRHWSTHYRGPLAIHAAKTRDHCSFMLEPAEGVRAAFAAAGITRVDQLAFGCIVATCTLSDCVATSDLVAAHRVSPDERRFGNYDPGRFGWILTDIVRLPKPIPCRGAQGFFTWNPPTDLPEPNPAFRLYS